MILSEVIRIFDINWINALWGLIWFFCIIGLYTALVIGYSRISAVNHFKKNTMPDLYAGKLKIAENQVRILKSENKKLIIENRNVTDRLRVIKKSVEV